MISINLKTLAFITNGRLVGDDKVFYHISSDTRKIRAGSLFIALPGKIYNGHDFIYEAINLGAIGILASSYMMVNISQVIVDNTRIALGLLASWVRNNLDLQVIALTGSSGKTIVKEITSFILSLYGSTAQTKYNLNNDIGVSKTLLSFTHNNKYGVVELGATCLGEIKYSVNLVSPDVVLVNNIFPSHLEGFGSIDNLINAKGEIFNGLRKNGIAIINICSNGLLRWKDKLCDKNIWYFSLFYNVYSSFYASDISVNKFSSNFLLNTPIGKIKIQLPLIGIHNIVNAIAASALAVSVNVPINIIQYGLNNFQGITGRLYPIHINGTKLILDDTYNSNIGSISTAINVLAQMDGYLIIVLGDMLGLGYYSYFYHYYIGQLIRFTKINRVLSIGKFSRIISIRSGIGKHFNNKHLLVRQLKILISKYDSVTILVKGSRNLHMEEIIQFLLGK